MANKIIEVRCKADRQLWLKSFYGKLIGLRNLMSSEATEIHPVVDRLNKLLDEYRTEIDSLTLKLLTLIANELSEMEHHPIDEEQIARYETLEQLMYQVTQHYEKMDRVTPTGCTSPGK